MNEMIKTPEFLFESSWEVCNKVGGIYTVLSTKAHTLQQIFNDKVIFIGPDVWANTTAPDFTEDASLFEDWRKHAEAVDHLKVKVGRWNVPGTPPVILVDFKSYFSERDAFFYSMWENFRVDSIHAYGDYDESCIFAYAVGKVIESFYHFYKLENKKVAALFNEWMLAMGALYIQKQIPAIATLFTTHATSIGRSIAGNNKALYAYMDGYNGDQMAKELNMEAKHSVEKQAAHYVDCFTTVSEITNNECKELLDKPADVVLMNGFEDDFVPKGSTFTGKRKRARSTMLRVANSLLGQEFDDDTLIIGTSGRYEFKNKGIDVFLESLNRLNRDKNLNKKVLAFVNVPGWVGDPREDLQQRLKKKDEHYTTPLEVPFITHWLHNMTHDQVLDMLKYLGMGNRPEDKVKVIFVPCYLDGKDGILNKHYYDLILGEDLSVYPSYYEPWGYTPLESVAFRVPTITTDLAGFGLWVNSLKNQHGINDGVEVLHRSDYNYSEVADGIKDTITLFSTKTDAEIKEIRKRAAQVAEQALWKHFIQYYYEAYDLALRNAMKRQLG